MEKLENVSAEEVRERLLQEVAHLSEEELNRKKDEETWSIGQICEHLSLMDQRVRQTIVYTMNKAEKETASVKPIEMALDRQTKIEAPEIVMPGNGPYNKEDLFKQLEASKQEFDQTLAEIDEQELTERSSRHPVFSHLSLKQWVELRTYHEMRHIEQIQEIKQAS